MNIDSKHLLVLFASIFVIACAKPDPEVGCIPFDTISGPNGFLETAYSQGVCFEFTPRLAASVREKLMRSYDPILKVNACLQDEFPNRDLVIPNDITGVRRIDIIFAVRPPDKYNRNYDVDYASANLYDSSCVSCLLTSEYKITYPGDPTNTTKYSLGNDFYATLRGHAEKQRYFYSAVVTVAASSSPIRRFVFDPDLCAANTSTNSTDWVEIDADDNIVPIYGTGVT